MFKAKVNAKGLFLALALLTVLLAACGQDTTPLDVVEFPTDTPVPTASPIPDAVVLPVSTLEILPGDFSILLGGESLLDAILKDSEGRELTDRAVTWASNNPGVAIVDPISGAATGVGVGSAVITASSEGITQSVTATVQLIAVAAVEIVPPVPSVNIAAQVRLDATTLDNQGNELTGRSVIWTSDNPQVATIDPVNGLVTGLSEGSTVITASVEGVNRKVTLGVEIAPVDTVAIEPPSPAVAVADVIQLSAMLSDPLGNPLTDRQIIWISDNQAVAVVDPNTGLVTGLSVGTAGIIASSEGVNQPVTVNVQQAQVATIEIEPPDPRVIVRGDTQFTAILKDGLGNQLTGRAVVWTSSNSTVATVDSETGVVSGVAPGDTDITASSEGVEERLGISVILAPITTVLVLPLDPSVVVSGQSQLIASLLDELGNELSERQVNWSSDNQAAATVGPSSGLVSGVAVGVANITATSEGISQSVNINVQSAPVFSVEVLAPQFPIVEGATLTLNISSRDVGGGLLEGRTAIWTSDAQDVATVNVATGEVNGIEAGVANITATVEGKQSAVQITVAHGPVASVLVTPANASVIEGAQALGGTTQPFSAILKDAAGHDIEDDIDWSSADQAVAAVDFTTGLVSGIDFGSTKIIATSGGVKGEAVIIVQHGPAAAIQVSSSANTLVEGTTFQGGTPVTMSAKLKDAKGHTVSGGVSWKSSNTGRAKVTSGGIVTGFSDGSVTITAISNSGDATEDKALTVVHGSPNVVTISTTSTISIISPAIITKDTTFGSSIDPAALLPGFQVIEGNDKKLFVTVKDAKGHVLSGESVTWTSNDSNVLKVLDSATGEFEGVTAGAATISATTSNNKVKSQEIEVLHGPVAAVQMCGSLIMVVGTTTTLTATLKDVFGHELDLSLGQWSSSAPVVVSVSIERGDPFNKATLAAGPFGGTAEITGTFGDIQGTAVVSAVFLLPFSQPDC